MSYERIRIMITPLWYEGVYSDVIDVTEDIDITAFVKDNIGSIRREIDNGDYDFGMFVFGSVILRCFNDEGLFSSPEDSRSIFKYSRDLARVKLVYLDEDNNQSVLFEGIINDDTSRDEDLPDDDIKTGTIKFRVLSLDSIFRHVNITGGTIATGVLLSTAIKQLLNTTRITNVLSFDPVNINVDTDVIIDEGEYFSGMSAKDALDELLLAANSILLIDDDKNIIVTPRVENIDTYSLYAPHDPLGCGNILEVKGYNSGLQRAFSVIEVNDTEVSDLASVDDYGSRKKSINLDFITNPESEEIIATNLLNEFKTPRPECVVKVPFIDIANIKLMDQAMIDYPLRVIPPPGEEFITTVNTMVIGTSKINQVSGSISISPKVQWKVISITPDPKNFISSIKLRQIGKEYGQGIAND